MDSSKSSVGLISMTRRMDGSELKVSVQRSAQPNIISPGNSQGALTRFRGGSSLLGITALLHDDSKYSIRDVSYPSQSPSSASTSSPFIITPTSSSVPLPPEKILSRNNSCNSTISTSSPLSPFPELLSTESSPTQSPLQESLPSLPSSIAGSPPIQSADNLSSSKLLDSQSGVPLPSSSPLHVSGPQLSPTPLSSRAAPPPPPLPPPTIPLQSDPFPIPSATPQHPFSELSTTAIVDQSSIPPPPLLPPRSDSVSSSICSAAAAPPPPPPPCGVSSIQEETSIAVDQTLYSVPPVAPQPPFSEKISTAFVNQSSNPATPLLPLPPSPRSNSVSSTISLVPPPPPPPPPPVPSSTNEETSTIYGQNSVSIPPTAPQPPFSEKISTAFVKQSSTPVAPLLPLLPFSGSNSDSMSICSAPPAPSIHKKTSARSVQTVPPPPPVPSIHDKTSARSAQTVPPPPPAPSIHDKTSARSAQTVPPPPPPLLKGVSKANGIVPVPPLSIKGTLQSWSATRVQVLSRKTSLKPYHWLKLTRAIQGSIWAEAQKPEDNSKAPELDMSELESLFSVSLPNSDHGGVSGKTSRRNSLQKSDKVQLIDHRRAYNCEIMLKKVKVPLSDLVNSILDLDDLTLDIDQVDNLVKFCPTKEEIELLKNYKGDKENLGTCEQFFLELMKVPRVESKLRVFSFKIQFWSQVSDLRNSLRIVSSASEEVRGSVKLKRIMKTILSLGNALNHGTAKGSAVGFRLDSLPKLTETRARNNKLTLMHYLCKVLAKNLPEVLDFQKDLSCLEAASKIQLKYLAEEMQAIYKGLEKVVQELTASKNDGHVSERFCQTLEEFLGSAEAEVRSLASLYSEVGRTADALAFYFGEDPARCPFEQVVSTLLNFTRMFHRANMENLQQLEFEKKKAQREAENEKAKVLAAGKDCRMKMPKQVEPTCLES